MQSKTDENTSQQDALVPKQSPSQSDLKDQDQKDKQAEINMPMAASIPQQDQDQFARTFDKIQPMDQLYMPQSNNNSRVASTKHMRSQSNLQPNNGGSSDHSPTVKSALTDNNYQFLTQVPASSTKSNEFANGSSNGIQNNLIGTIEDSRDDLSSNEYEEFEEEIEEEIEEEYEAQDCIQNTNESSPKRSAMHKAYQNYRPGTLQEVEVIEEADHESDRPSDLKHTLSMASKNQDDKSQKDVSPSRTPTRFVADSPKKRSSNKKNSKKNSSKQKSNNKYEPETDFNSYEQRPLKRLEGQTRLSSRSPELNSCQDTGTASFHQAMPDGEEMLEHNVTNSDSRRHSTSQQHYRRQKTSRSRESEPDTMRGELLQEKWSLMAEKNNLRDILKELLIQVSTIQEVCNKQTVQQDSVLRQMTEQNYSHHSGDSQIKSLAELSLLTSSHNLLLSGNQQRLRLESDRNFMDRTNAELMHDARSAVERLNPKFTSLLKGQNDLLQSLAKERERNYFLQVELSRREEQNDSLRNTLSSPNQKNSLSPSEVNAQEGYIAELEQQLQGARADLLQTKLRISDMQVENQSLKHQIDSQLTGLQRFQEENRESVMNVENLRQQLHQTANENLELTNNLNALCKQAQTTKSQQSTSSYSQNVEKNQERRRSVSANRSAPTAVANTMTGSGTAVDFLVPPEDDSYAQQRYVNAPHAFQLDSTGSKIQNQSNLSNSFNKGEMQKQIEMLNRHVVETGKRQESLEEVETTLMIKLDQKETENIDLKQLISDQKGELQVKSDAIGKAQHIIQRFVEKSDDDDQQIAVLKKENSMVRSEATTQSRACKEAEARLQKVMEQQKVAQTRLEGQMEREMVELRQSMNNLQQEYEAEKRHNQDQTRELTDQLLKREIDCETEAREFDNVRNELHRQLEEKDGHIQELVHDLTRGRDEMDAIRNEVEAAAEMKLEKANSQISYLQKRLHDVVEDFQQQQTETASVFSPNSTGVLSQSKVLSNKGTCVAGTGNSHFSYAVVVKNELEGISNEIIALREALRGESAREDALVNQKLSRFDEFRLHVIDQLILWDEKTAELANLASRYYGALEEQKRLFVKLKLVVHEKDQMVSELQRQLVLRDQSAKDHLNVLKLELNRTMSLCRNDFLSTIELLEQDCAQKETEIRLLDDRIEDLQKQATDAQVARDEIERKYAHEKCRGDNTDQEFMSFRKRQYDLFEKLREMLNMGNNHPNDIEIENSVGEMLCALSEARTEADSNSSEIKRLETDHEEEKQLLMSQVHNIEDQLQSVQRQAIQKEEELQLSFSDKESTLLQDMQEARLMSENSRAEASVRERQLRKIEDKLELELKRHEENAVIVARLQHERESAEVARDSANRVAQSLEKALDDAKETIRTNVNTMEALKQELDNTTKAKEDNEDHIMVLNKQLQDAEQLEQSLRKQISELELLVVQQNNEQAKKQDEYQTLNQRFTEATRREDSANDLISQLEKESKEKQQEIDFQRQQCNIYQEECLQFQRTVSNLSRELDLIPTLQAQNDDLMVSVKQQDLTLDTQRGEISELRRLVRGPQKHNMGVQASDNSQEELKKAFNELQQKQNQLELIAQETGTLREALHRTNLESSRALEDKRDLQEMIERLTQNLNYHKQQHSHANMLLATFSQNNLNKENQASNIKRHVTHTIDSDTTGGINAGAQSLSHGDCSNADLVGQVLAEKESYIAMLESELKEMRGELESQRDKIIMHEMNTLVAVENNGGHVPAYATEVNLQQQFSNTKSPPFSGNFGRPGNQSNMVSQTSFYDSGRNVVSFNPMHSQRSPSLDQDPQYVDDYNSNLYKIQPTHLELSSKTGTNKDSIPSLMNQSIGFHQKSRQGHQASALLPIDVHNQPASQLTYSSRNPYLLMQNQNLVPRELSGTSNLGYSQGAISVSDNVSNISNLQIHTASAALRNNRSDVNHLVN